MRHLDAILRHLKFGKKIRILAVLAPKTLEKATQLHLSSAKKGATLHFKRLKMFSLKNSAKIDEFCTLCEFLTPNAERFRGGVKTRSFSFKNAGFAVVYSSQKKHHEFSKSASKLS